MTDTPLLTTPLYKLHLELGARMVPFAGYQMPVQFPTGLVAEHHYTRSAAGLFDVSHMGQLLLKGEKAARALESLIPMDVIDLPLGKQRYGLLLNADGGIIDDLMFVNRGDDLLLIVNGACKAGDIAHIKEHIARYCEVIPLPDMALLALQGPKAVTVLTRLFPAISTLAFMTGQYFIWQNEKLFITRSGYTGEDGFEISLPATIAETFARELLQHAEVKPIGLGARNSLRLEAGLCLYGNDIDHNTTPIEANLTWSIQKVRRPSGERMGGFPAHLSIYAQLNEHTPLNKVRVGLIASERIPVREPANLLDEDGDNIGKVTSGLLSPTLDKPIAMGYVAPDYAQVGTTIYAQVRDNKVAMTVVRLPFVPQKYYKP